MTKPAKGYGQANNEGWSMQIIVYKLKTVLLRRKSIVLIDLTREYILIIANSITIISMPQKVILKRYLLLIQLLHIKIQFL